MTQPIYPNNPPAQQAGVKGVETPVNVSPNAAQDMVAANPVEPSAGVAVASQEITPVSVPLVPEAPIPTQAEVSVAPVPVVSVPQAELTPVQAPISEVVAPLPATQVAQVAEPEKQEGKAAVISSIDMDKFDDMANKAANVGDFGHLTDYINTGARSQ